MDPKLAQLPELADQDSIVFLSVFRSTYGLSSLLFYLSIERVKSSSHYVCVHIPLGRLEPVLTDVMQVPVLCKTQTQVFYPLRAERRQVTELAL